MAFKTFTSGAVLTAAEINTYLMQQAVIVCTSATRPSSPVEGMRIVETDTDYEFTYSGSAWVQTGSFGAWATYTPSWTNVTQGTGPTNEGRYTLHGRMCTFRASLILGTSGAVTGAVTVSLPVTAATVTTGQRADTFALSTSRYQGGATIASAATTASNPFSGTAANAWDATTPFTWAATHQMHIYGTYETA